MAAVNILPQRFPLAYWKEFVEYWGGRGLLFAEDTSRRGVVEFKVTALGTKVIIDRGGRVVYRAAGPTGYQILRAEVNRAL